MNFVKYLISCRQNLGVKDFKRVGLPIPFWRRGFKKFHQLQSNWFFVFQIRNYFGKKFSQIGRRHRPHDLISMRRILGFSTYKTQTSSPSLKNPFDCGGFSIVACKNWFVNKVFAAVSSISRQTKTAFCVYKSGNIRKFLLRKKFNLFALSKSFHGLFVNKILSIFQFFKMKIQSFLFFFRCGVIKICNQFSLFFFFYKIRKEDLGKKITFFPSKVKMKLRFLVLKFYSFICKFIDTSKLIREKFYDLWIYRRNNEDKSIFRCARWPYVFRNMKTSVSISVTSCIGKNKRV